MFGVAKLYAGAAAILALLLGLWAVVHSLEARGAQQCKAEVATAVANQAIAAAKTESEWKGKVDEIHRATEIQIQNVNAALDAARAGLRNRAPSRVAMPEAATAACSGVTPAALSAADADVALGLAAEADRLRAAIEEYQAWLRAVDK